MYESYYGFKEKPFSLTPDPKYLYRSESHANAFDLLQYAIRRREGFVVVTGDIGTGKTTLCRALLEEIDRTTFTALVLNPFMSEEDLLKRVLQDFGVVSRADVKSGRLAGVSKQELIDALYDFLLSLIPLKASAVLIIDEAQNLPLKVLEQIRILSNLETDKEKLLQIILVGQLNLKTLLRSPDLRQLDQRVSIRYELAPLNLETVGAYVAHRLTVAGGSQSVTFTPKALSEVHRLTGGIPRLINLICDRALLSGFSIRANRITDEMVAHAAVSLDLQKPGPPRFAQMKRRASLFAAAAVVLFAASLAMGSTTYVYKQIAGGTSRTATLPGRLETVGTAGAVETARARDVQLTPLTSIARALPANAEMTILVGSYPAASADSTDDVRALTNWLEASGFPVFYADIDLGPRGRWHRVLAGAYTDPHLALRDAERLKAAAPSTDAHVVSAGFAMGLTARAEPEPGPAWRPGTAP
jgi:type II secretory pathway predicted ATPase ExeA